ncbi:hypothetical protein HKX48_002860 [Thoreauomyces humboldtii]|nr:hypothetical protein HKX48_002860 [Thoreauomyces humboldtii]
MVCAASPVVPSSRDGSNHADVLRHSSPPLAADLKWGGMPLGSIDTNASLLCVETGRLASPPTDSSFSSQADQEPTTSSPVEIFSKHQKEFLQPEASGARPQCPSGLSGSDTKSCRRMMQELHKHASSWPFKVPVDPKLASAPDYFDVIKKPMDLSTVESKLSSLQYAKVQDFADDIQLMLNNAFLYNPPSNCVHQLGRSLERYFLSVLHRLFPTITTLTIPETEGEKTDPDPSAWSNRSWKRSVRAPKLFEPPTPAKKQRMAATAKRRNSTTAIPTRVEEAREWSDDDVAQKMSNLASCLQTINEQMADLTASKPRTKRRRSSVSAAVPSPSTVKRRRPSRAEIFRSPALSSPLKESPLEDVDHDTKLCEHCATNETPMWRRGPSGCATLCNKCGVKWRSGRLTDETKAPASGSTSPTAPPRPSNSSSGPCRESLASKYRREPTPLTYEEKTTLSELLTSLPEDKLREALDVIRRGLPQGLSYDTEEEIELDIEAMDGQTLHELNAFVLNNAPRRKGKLDKMTTPNVTYEQKKMLSKRICSLSEDQMARVLDIIRSGIPHLKHNTEEIELDIDAIDETTLRKLYAYVESIDVKYPESDFDME